jgi:lipid II:glycine glycyltransferase (peptidoglycan interpeptide bridge formation enzyme)
MERFSDMLITERKFGIFKFVNIYFVEELVNVNTLDYDVITNHSYENWGDIKGYRKNKCLTTIIDLSQDIDVIWKKFNRQHKRHIRRAENNGTNVTVNKYYDEFYQINKKFLQQKKFADLSRVNILSSQFMQKYGILFIAENQGEILGGNLYFHDKDNALLVGSAYKNKENTTENKKRSTDINCYLHWEAMQYLKNLGITNYDLGDVSSDNININHHLKGGEYFKRCFGGDVIPRYQYLKFNSRFNKLLLYSWNFWLSFA